MYSRGCGYETPEEDDNSEEEEDDGPLEAISMQQRFHRVGDDAIKKPVSVDSNGFPYGIMKTCLEDDVKLFAKDLDPTLSWEMQPLSEKERFFKRLYASIFVF